MKIGIGLPGTIPGVHRELIFDWARRAESGPFSSLATLDRLVYPNYEALMTLAAVAGVTQRVRLVTTVLLAPLRRPAILAKQAASLDALSGGRLTLGLGVGGREDDYRAVAVPFNRRGKYFDEQLAIMKRVWSDQPLSADVGAIGPLPVQQGGPEILIGGYTPAAVERIGRWGEGYISGGGGPERAESFFKMAQEVWEAAGRSGKPRLVGCTYYGLGPNAPEAIGAYIGNYYSFLGPMAQQMAKTVPASPEAIKGAIQGFANIGADEVILWPCIPKLDQVDRLAELVG